MRFTSQQAPAHGGQANPAAEQASSHLPRNPFLAHLPLDTRDAHQPSPLELEHAGASAGSPVGAAVGAATGAAVVPSLHAKPCSVQASSHLLRNLLLAHWPLLTRLAHQPSPFELKHGGAVGAAVGTVGAAVGVATGAAVVPSSHGLPYSVQASSHLSRHLLVLHLALVKRDAHHSS